MQDKELFAPPSETWIPLSPKWVVVQRITCFITWFAVFAAIFGLLICYSQMPETKAQTPSFLDQILKLLSFFPITIPLALAFIIFRVWRQKAIVAAWGYAERESDLYIRHGIWYKVLTVIPYGRMQAVEAHAGPISRLFGLSNVTLITASASSNAVIYGLDTDQAIALRDRLTALGEDQAIGL